MLKKFPNFLEKERYIKSLYFRGFMDNQSGFAHLLIMLILLVGIGFGVYLVGQRTNIFPKAASNPISGPINPSPTPFPSLTPLPTVTPSLEPTAQPTPSDQIAPVVTITYPQNNTKVRRGQFINLQANASDNIGVVKVEFYVNSSLVCSDSSPAYQCNWRVPSDKRSQHLITAKAYDGAGNASTATITVQSN